MKLSDVPLTEYSREEGLIAPDFEGLPLHLPRRCLMAFLGEKRIAAFAESRKGKVIGSFLSLTKSFPLYEIPGKEPLLLVQSPAGAPAAVLIEERLFAYGAEKVLAIGCCGSLTDIPENCFFPIEKALRDEGTSFHYLPPSRFIEMDKAPLLHLKDYFKKKGLPFRPAATWTSDGFFRETEEKIRRRREEERLHPGGYGSQRPRRLRPLPEKGIRRNHVHRRHPGIPCPRPAPLGPRKPKRRPCHGYGSTGRNIGGPLRVPGFRGFPLALVNVFWTVFWTQNLKN